MIEYTAIVTTVDSPDDGGFYADVYEYETGKTIGQTREVYSSRAEAFREGKKIATMKGYTVRQHHQH